MTAGTAAPAATRSYVRGSGLLFAGRLLALGLNCLVQVLIVRYLAKDDYGAFAYGLATVTLLSTMILCGLGKALPRVVAVHQEKQEHARAFGSIVLAAAFVLSLGAFAVVLVQVFGAELRQWLAIPPSVLPVLLILIVVAPLDALDHLMQHLAAIFCGARAIFLRRHVVGPSMKLAAIVLVIALSGTVTQLAFGYVAASVIGVSLYVWALLRQWRAGGMLQYLRPSRWRLPVRELFGFSLPLASSDIAVAVRGSFAILLLGYFGTVRDVAEYRAVLPLAGLNMVAADTFAFLFVPVASRLFARDDRPAMNTLYWHSSLWIAVLTLPVFVMTVALAAPLVAFVFGPEYAASAPILAILAVGYYVNAAVGFNAAMLRVTGRLRTIVANDVIAAAFCIGATVLLVRYYGAIGAAVATSATFIVHNLLNYLGLSRRRSAVLVMHAPVMRLYAWILTIALTVVAATWLFAPPLLPGIACAAAASALVVRIARRVLNFDGTFPELQRVPMLRWLVG
jgi:O-antigen/teichoic acid export membrane protein